MREREREREGMKEREKKYRTLTHIVTLPTIWQMVLMASTTMLAVLVVVVKGAVLAVRMWLDPWQRRQRRQRRRWQLPSRQGGRLLPRPCPPRRSMVVAAVMSLAEEEKEKEKGCRCAST